MEGRYDMLKTIILKNIRDFAVNKTVLFIFFIFTFIVVSFSMNFVLNILGRSFILNDNVGTKYFFEFATPQELSYVNDCMKKSGLYPSTVFYMNEISAKKVSFQTQKIKNSDLYLILMTGTKLEENDSLGVYVRSSSSIYRPDNRLLVYGRKLNKADQGENNATISYHLSGYVEDSTITVDDITYSVVGCVQEATAPDLSSICVSEETFNKNGYLVKKVYCIFDISPLGGSVEKFESQFDAEMIGSSKSSLNGFGLHTVIAMLTNGGLYLFVFAFIIISIIGIFNCRMTALNRTYSIYRFCGMTKFCKMIAIVIEMFVYIFISYSIGTVLFYIILNSGYKKYIYFPHPAMIIANFIIIFVCCSIIAVIKDAKSEKNSIAHNI